MGSWNTSWLTSPLGLFGAGRPAPEPTQLALAIADSVETLRDGSRVLVRAVRPDDKERLLAGFEALSERSRMLRFCAPKRDLSEQELRYLTEVDGIDHVALGALRLRPGRAAEPAGIARFIRLEPQGNVAEAAVAVSDALQGKGLGTLLMQRLGEAARARGIEHFRCLVLDENHGMQRLLTALDPDVHVVKSVSGTREFELAVPGTSLPELSLSHLVRQLEGRAATSSVSGA